MSTEFNRVNEIKNRNQQAILSRQNVVGVGTGYKQRRGAKTNQLCIVTLVNHKVPQAGLAAADMLPRDIEGIPTDVIEVGDLVALQSPTDVWRPAPGGVSIGHFRISAGTFGCVVYDRQSGERLILSNNHVLANSNDAQLGDNILQPGAIDGGRVKDHTLAYLERYNPIVYLSEDSSCSIANAVVTIANAIAELLGSSHRISAQRFNSQAVNPIDAALARPVNNDDILDEILQIGEVHETAEAILGMAVRKSGRTTGLTTGTITVLNATVDVGYTGDRVARFENQIVTSPMSEGGDSGSLLVAGDALKAVGLLFAGSSQATIFNPIQTVLDILEVDLDPHAYTVRAEKTSKSRQLAFQQAEEVKQAYEPMLLSKPNVVGVGVGMKQTGGDWTDEIGIIVMVSQKVPEAQLAPEDILPTNLEGIAVDVQEVGRIKANKISY